MKKEILAKNNPKESLIEHTQNSISIWNQLKKRYYNNIENEEIWNYSLVSIIFHDLGKATDNFQSYIYDPANYNKRKNNIRHEFISGMILYFLNNNYYNRNPLSLLALFSHHKPLKDTMFDVDMVKELKIDIDNFLSCTKNFINLTNKYLKDLTFNLFDENSIKKIRLESLNNIFKDIFGIFLNKVDSQKQRVEYIYYKAILNIADWLASGHNKLCEDFKIEKEYIKNKIIEKLIQENKIKSKEDFKFRGFQINSIVNKNVIAIAPTGSGKTEASLLWATNKNEYSKVFYLLPTRVTSNSIFERLKEYFGKENVALIHSSAFLYQKELDDSYNKIKYLLDKTFFKQINVGTVDQVLTQGFNLGYWEIKTFNMINSYIIIDEIHLYEPYTLGLVVKTIEYLSKNFGVIFFIMSATLPLKLKEIFIKTMSENLELIEDKELLNNSRNTFETRDCYIDDLYNEIKDAFGKKILIVVNTVNEAIRLYEKYKDESENVYCYHSRFIQKHRIKKETEILDIEKRNVPMILIATQVVEVSLDIDFDIMFTENAPIDAIIQRAGRVNRKRDNNKNSKVVIFNHSDVSKEFVYKEVKDYNILEKTFELLKSNNNRKLTEKELLEMVNNVYHDFDVTLTDSYKTGVSAYFEYQNQNNYILDNTGLKESYTRQDMNTINIIPGCFLEYLSDENIELEEKVKYEVTIQKKKSYFLKIKDIDGFKYLLDCDYDYEKGLVFKSINNTSFFF